MGDGLLEADQERVRDVQEGDHGGKPFNDAYRYMDWLLTVPLLLIEIIFCCNLSPDETVKKSWALGVSSGLMIALGYPGEMIIEGAMGVRFMFWAAAMVP